MYELFDNVMLMREGRIVYHGPRKLVLPYFADMGLACPDDSDAADFFVDFLSDPPGVWERELQRMRVARGDPSYTPAVTPPLTTRDMVVYLQAAMHVGEWAILKDYTRSVTTASLRRVEVEAAPPHRTVTPALSPLTASAGSLGPEGFSSLDAASGSDVAGTGITAASAGTISLDAQLGHDVRASSTSIGHVMIDGSSEQMLASHDSDPELMKEQLTAVKQGRLFNILDTLLVGTASKYINTGSLLRHCHRSSLPPPNPHPVLRLL